MKMIDKMEFCELLKQLDGQPLTEYSRLNTDIYLPRYVVRKMTPVLNESCAWSPLTIRIPQKIAGFPDDLASTPERRIALEDYLARNLARVTEKSSHFDERGIAFQHLAVVKPGSKIIPRTTVVVNEDYIELRIRVKLPQRYGRIPGDELEVIFFDELPSAVTEAFIYCNLDQEELEEFLNAAEEACGIRQELPSRGLVGFVGQNTVLKQQRDGAKNHFDNEWRITIEDALMTQIDTSGGQSVSGLGINEGITLLLGNECSGRGELIKALASGIYNHVPNDGRERVLTVSDAVHVLSEPGRSIQKVDLSAFISGMPGNREKSFSTNEAGAFESQAAGVVEALESGCRVLLFDESDSCAGFLSGDQWLSSFLDDGGTSSIPLAARARQIADELGVSMIIAGSGGIADFIPIADHVLKIENGKISDITDEVKAVGVEAPVYEPLADANSLGESKRYVIPTSIDPSYLTEDAHIIARDVSVLEFGRHIIDMQAVRQLVDIQQTMAIGRLIYHVKLNYLDDPHTIGQILDYIDEELGRNGLENLSGDVDGETALPRRHEIAAALNRLRSLRVTSGSAGAEA